MNRIRWTVAALVALVLLTASFPTTEKSKGLAKEYAVVSGAGQVIGPRGPIPAGWTFLSIGEVGGGSTPTVFEIGSDDMFNSTRLDTFELGNGVGLNDRFGGEIDSLNVLTLGSGARWHVAVTN